VLDDRRGRQRGVHLRQVLLIAHACGLSRHENGARARDEDVFLLSIHQSRKKEKKFAFFDREDGF
jgi:hypothetical protein